MAYLLHHFTLAPSPDHPIGDPIADRLFLDGFTLSPKPFYALLTPRGLVDPVCEADGTARGPPSQSVAA